MFQSIVFGVKSKLFCWFDEYFTHFETVKSPSKSYWKPKFSESLQLQIERIKTSDVQGIVEIMICYKI